MEMERVPAAGYEIIGLPVAGLQRKLTLSNLALPFKVIRSIGMAKKVIREFKPDIAIGVGGYASAPLLWAAGRLGIPTLIQEQNGFAGLTNKILGKKAKSICVAYEGMERFFPADRIILTGNPIRKEIVPATPRMKEEAMEFYGLDPQKKHIFIVGGSLGSATLNNAMKKWISDGCPGGDGLEIIWQCGRYYKPVTDAFMKEAGVLCSSCRYCVSACPMELDIPLLIKGYNVLNTSGSTWRAEGFDKAKSADHCIGCGACTKVCPQQIDIPGTMKKFTELMSKPE